MKEEKDFQAISHTADLQLQLYGSTLADLFRNAVIGMFQSIGPRAEGCSVVNERLVCAELPREHAVKITAKNVEQLLVDFLSYALYLSDIHNEAYLDAVIHEIDSSHIAATLRGISIQGFEVVEIKAVTYHGLRVIKHNDHWQAAIVFDI